MKKKVLSFISALVLSVLTISNVCALTVADAGENYDQQGEYSSTRFIAGNKVTNKAKVDGLSFVAGNELDLKGSAPYGFYAGNVITINEQIEKDMFIAGNSINIGSEAVIGRDLFVAGSSVKLNTNVGRDVRIGAGTVDLSNVTIGGDAYIDAGEIILNENTTIVGKLTYQEDANVKGLDKATIGSIKKTKIDTITIEMNLKDKIYGFILSTAAGFVVLLALFYIIPKSKTKLDKTKLDGSTIMKRVVTGLVVLVVVPFISIVAMFTGVLMPLALITLAVYVIAIYLSSLLSYYVVGKLIMDKAFKNDNKYLTILTGILVVKLLTYVPVLGVFIGAFALLYGMGLVYKFIESKEK